MASGKAPAENMLWGGRFTGWFSMEVRVQCGLDPLMLEYNASIEYDKRLYKEDILGSIAFARANAKSGVISNSEFAEIERGLREVQKEWEANAFVIMPNDEDIHTANERRLGEIIGMDIAGKLHTGRSRNEQVVCDMRMWLRNQIKEIESHLVVFIETIASRAEAECGIIMPGYTHLQRAMPVLWSQHLLSYGFYFASDLERLRETLKRVNRSPLGCGALAGNGFNIDRDMMAEELGFDGLLWNSMNAVGDRDFVTEFLQWGSMFMQHISRWAEDLVLYSTMEFDFISIADAYSTGSSLMPHKKNPDGLEPPETRYNAAGSRKKLTIRDHLVLRGKAGRAFGHMAGLMMTQKSLPSTYSKDLQESWEPMLDHVKTISDSLRIANGILVTLTIKPEKMRAALDPFMLATDLADYLVRKGVPFRETHHISGRCVAKSEELGIPMNELSLEQLQAIDSRFGEDVSQTFDYDRSVEMRSVKGGTSRARVLEQVKVLKDMLA
ncbi:argininosuccinate lyase [Cordyceps militaris CM01]|uniref:argininosuccinate lyase n=1 Tax=Cordyceps militaris (strain CM01) TaxID=983644 RepID=G3JPH6_CORMM|nr:argininosuccinate lyase [Cordyceps militaris CM01]EGX89786.1 argininosuccinate lyase [Cordyceps militaris CM01]